MRKGTIVALTGAVLLLGTGTAEASRFEFRGDRGTRCTVEVGAAASHGINLLQLPRVGFTADPVCAYPPGSAAANAGKGGAPAAKKKKSCSKRAKAKQKKKGKKKGGKRGCKGKKRRDYALTTGVTATIQHAQLFLLGAGGAVAGQQTLANLGVGGYACSVLSVVSSCSDQGSLSPAVPQSPYQARYEFTVAPPLGERWAAVPAGCTGASSATCSLFSPNVIPLVL